jgi:hypothetical protein
VTKPLIAVLVLAGVGAVFAALRLTFAAGMCIGAICLITGMFLGERK